MEPKNLVFLFRILSYYLKVEQILTLRVTILLQGSTDAQKLGTRSKKRVYQKIKNKNKPDSNITKDYCS